jgi:SAM-dependent methyltransferase
MVALLDDESLERSAVVANCRMNRERSLTGSNGYDRELRFNPIDVIAELLTDRGQVAWLDLCCGTGRALIEAGEHIRSLGYADRVTILGVDLAGMFWPKPTHLRCVYLVEGSLAHWQPTQTFDLITCVHGLHYVGDKLGLIARALSWLAADGLFAGNLDLANVKWADGTAAGRQVAALLRRAGCAYDRRHRLVTCHGRRLLGLPLSYVGADDAAGPNYTGQPAVDSYYAARAAGRGTGSP